MTLILKRWPLSFGIVGLLLLVAVVLRELSGSELVEPVRTNPSDAPHALPSDIVGFVHGRLSPGLPGFGTTDYPGNAAEHIPKAYAMVLLGEVQRRRNGLRPDLPNLGPAAGRWLLDNADLDGDGTMGWGVPVAWDAYGDGSENPANTAYTISTAIVVDSLITWMLLDPKAPGAEIVGTVSAALRPFTDPSMRSPSGMAPYSFRVSDRVYDTFNPAAYLAGQLQRFSRFEPDVALARALADAADRTMDVLLREHRVNPTDGGWYWSYSIQEAVANDLAHASYIVEGILSYGENGGRHAWRFDVPAVLQHLATFEDPASGVLRGWPRVQGNIKQHARLYDLGMLMTMACTNPGLDRLVPAPSRHVVDYFDRQRNSFAKFPLTADFGDPLTINEYETYLYRALIECALRAEPPEALPVPTPVEQIAGSSAREIPFVTLPLGERVLMVGDKPVFGLQAKGLGAPLWLEPGQLPIWTGRAGDWYLVIMRGIDGGRLQLLGYRDGAGKPDLRKALRTSKAGDDGVLFRAAATTGSRVILVLYDSHSLRNVLLSFDVAGTDPIALHQEVTLPSVGDPAGWTYEMIPSVFLFTRPDRTDLAAGNLVLQIAADGTMISEARPEGCLRIVEAVKLEAGPGLLCQRLPEGETYFLVAPKGIEVDAISKGQLPGTLRVEGTRLSVEALTDTSSLREQFVMDLQRGQNGGLLDLGMDNIEGRIPWSQIYYLNGLIDLLGHLRTDPRMAKTFGALAGDLRLRLDLELALLLRHWREGRFATKTFTVDRSPAYFAVQTSRLLLLVDRYLDELPGPWTARLDDLSAIRRRVHCLEDHIDQLARGGEAPSWMARDAAHLRWPKGSAFSFDGLAVPFNHQNEWAYAVLRTGPETSCPLAVEAAADIIRHFVDRVAFDGKLPLNGVWPYWWGRAHDGWTEIDGLSVNKPVYAGDHSNSWISFRTIDAMSLLAASESLPIGWRENVLATTSHLVRNGLIYPFAAYELERAGTQKALLPGVSLRYARYSSPWEIQNAVWALRELVRTMP